MRRFVLILVMLLALDVFSQKSGKNADAKPHPSDSIYEPRYNKALSESKEEYKKSKIFANAIKIEPTLLLRKVLVMSYERQFSAVSFEIGAGVCLGVDPIFKFGMADLGMDLSFGLDEYLTLGDALSSSSGRESPGAYWHGIIKFFPFSHDYFEGGFFGLDTRHYSYSFNLSRTQVLSNTRKNLNNLSSEKFSLRTNSYNFLYGYQFLPGKSDKVTCEIYMGTGFHFTKYDLFELKTVGYSGPYTTIDEYFKSSREKSAFGFSLLFGVNFGLGF